MPDHGQKAKLQHAEHADRGTLEAFMSAVSQAVYQSSWFADLEYVLWEALEKADPHPFTAQQILELRALAEASCGWICTDQGRRRFLPLEEWRRHYDDHKKQSR
jgi:hypothetical protein